MERSKNRAKQQFEEIKQSTRARAKRLELMKLNITQHLNSQSYHFCFRTEADEGKNNEQVRLGIGGKIDIRIKIIILKRKFQLIIFYSLPSP